MSVDIRPERISAPADSARALRFARAAALVAVFLIASRQFVGEGVTLGHIATLLTAPLWIPALRRTVGAVWLAVGGAVAVLASVWLTFAAAPDHAWTMNRLVADKVLVGGVVTSIGVLAPAASAACLARRPAPRRRRSPSSAR